MTDPALLARATIAADRLARTRPEGQLTLGGPLLEVLYERIGRAGEQDPAIPLAVGEGDRVAAALAAGCPPQFHPGVPDPHATVLTTLRTRLGLDRTAQLVLPPDTEDRYVRILRALGCPVRIQTASSASPAD
jgi:hypothetical protein